MNYEKPEIAVLGDSAALIQANKQGGSESNLAIQQLVPANQVND
jgi:hypothetical protein